MWKAPSKGFSTSPARGFFIAKLCESLIQATLSWHVIGGVVRQFPSWATSVVKMRRCFTKLERSLLLARQGWLCGYCDKQLNVGDKIHIDHIKPFSKGGLTVIENGIACCESCNLKKAATFHDYTS